MALEQNDGAMTFRAVDELQLSDRIEENA